MRRELARETVAVSINLPENDLKHIDEFANAHGLTRSEFLLRRHSGDGAVVIATRPHPLSKLYLSVVQLLIESFSSPDARQGANGWVFALECQPAVIPARRRAYWFLGPSAAK